MDAITEYLGGRRLSLGQIRLDLSKTDDFDRRVYAAACRIGIGQAITYGELARDLGDPKLARAVGQALGRNPWPIVIPCHRIVGARGGAGGFSAHGGVATKFRLLELEGTFALAKLPLFASRDPD